MGDAAAGLLGLPARRRVRAQERRRAETYEEGDDEDRDVDQQLTSGQVRFVTLRSGDDVREVVEIDLFWRKTSKTVLDPLSDVLQLPFSDDPRFDVARALRRHLELQGIAAGAGTTPLFRAIKYTLPHPGDPPSGVPLKGSPVYTRARHLGNLRKLLGHVGYGTPGGPLADRKPDDFGLHSLRSGGATTLLALGVPWDVVKRLGNWKSDESMVNYDRRKEDLVFAVVRAIRAAPARVAAQAATA